MTVSSRPAGAPMDIVLATENPGKIREIIDVLDMPGLKFHRFDEVPDWPELEETGRTLDENAVLKANALLEHFGMPAIADDSGLLVDYLEGRPGVHSSRYAGPEGDAERNMDLLLAELEGVPDPKRTAHFVCVLALALPGGVIHTTRGECEGTILVKRRGSGGFGYDPVFEPDGYDRSMAELSLEEKNKISHRGRALLEMKVVLHDLLESQR